MLHVQWVNDLHALISPPAKRTPLALVLLGKVSRLFTRSTVHEEFLRFGVTVQINLRVLLQLQPKNALLSMFLFLDQFVWLGRTGIVKVCPDGTIWLLAFINCIVYAFFLLTDLFLLPLVEQGGDGPRWQDIPVLLDGFFCLCRSS